MMPDRDQARETLINQVLDATSLPQVKAAQHALREWIRTHPEEQEMRDGFEQLSLMEDIAEMEAAGLLMTELPPNLDTCDPPRVISGFSIKSPVRPPCPKSRRRGPPCTGGSKFAPKTTSTVTSPI